MEDHYLELIHQGKSEHEAIGAVISEFGSVDELLQELNVSKKKRRLMIGPMPSQKTMRLIIGELCDTLLSRYL